MRLSQLTGRFYIGLGIVLAIAGFGLLGPLVFRASGLNDVVGGLYDAPSGNQWLGTDNLGHDVFTQLMYGTRSSLLVGLVAGVASTLIGVVVGTLAGYLGGVIDEILTTLTNIVIATQQLVILILISIALHSRNVTSVAAVIAVTSWNWTARAVRAQASSVRTREHLDIARLSGAGTTSIILRDVIPYMLSYLAMAFVLQASQAILTEAALSLLGLGPSSGISLGMMLHWALAFESVRNSAWWAFVPPTLALSLLAFGFLLLQSSLDEVFNPRLQRANRRRRRRPVVAAPMVMSDVDEVAAVEAGTATGVAQ
jgi:peptide/nickel transport system permease protein